MGKTAKYNLPYPESTDKANVPQDLKNLAEQAETALDKKVNTEEGKRLITNTEAEKLAGLSNYDDTELKETLTNQEKKIEELEEENKRLLADHKKIPFNSSSNHLQDTGELPMPISINGGIEQDTREGYNLCNAPYTKDNKLTLTSTRDDYYAIVDYYAELEAGKTYTVQYKSDGTPGGANGTDTVQVFWLLDKTYGTTFQMNALKQTFTPTVSGKYYIRADVNANAKTYSFWNFMVYEGTEIKPYEQYGSMPSIDFPSEVKGVSGHYDNVVENKNFNFRPYKDGNDKVTNGITFSVNNNGSVVANGTAIANAYFYLHTQDTTPYLNLEKGIYTISGGINSNCKVIARLYKGSTYIAGATDSGNGAILDTTNYDYDRVLLFIEIPSGQVCNNLIFKPQIEKGTVATDYVEHQEQNYALDIPFNMYSGKPYKENGKWYRKVEWEKQELNSSLTIARYEINTFDCYRITNLQNLNNSTSAMIKSNIFKGIVPIYGESSYITNRKAGDIYINNVINAIDMLTEKGKFADVTSFINAVSGNYFIYQLATPIKEEITDTTLISQLEELQKVKSYYEVTNINSYRPTEDVAEMKLSGNALMSNDIRLSKLESALVSLGGI